VAAKKNKTPKPKKLHGHPAPLKKDPEIPEKRSKHGNAKRMKQKPLLPGSWKMNAVIFLLLVAGTLFIYSGDLHLGFFGVDDPGYVTDNPWIKSFNATNISHILSAPYFANYSPMHLFSYMVDFAIAGSNAFAFHLSSNIWAGICAGFVFLVALALTGHRIISVLAAILFVVHPAHVEAVAWISSRKDLIATAFALPSLLAYLNYRKGGTSSWRWYILSIILFLCAAAGKISVATFPAVFVAIDLFIEKRPFSRALIDKLPYLFIAGLIASVVYSSQPAGTSPNAGVFSAVFFQSMVLLSGFGDYVIYRLRPVTQGAGFEIISIVFFLILFIVPFFFRKRFSLAVVLIYWILLSWLPAQILSFIHPVSDRYLFFPSVAAVILVAWGIIMLSERFGRRASIAAIGSLLILAFFWARNGLNYLSEWRDPRSVWYAAMEKSSDPDVPYSLAGRYLEIASRIGENPRGEPLSSDEAKQIANAIWANDPRLPKLLAEWQGNNRGGPVEKEFQKYLWSIAWDDMELAVRTKGIHTLPYLYFRRGVLLLDKGDLEGARKEFLSSLKEISISTAKDVRDEIMIHCHHALGAICWKEGDLKEALRWLKMAEVEQTNSGKIWIADIPNNIKTVEEIMASSPSH
jgi:hypothetical protein